MENSEFEENFNFSKPDFFGASEKEDRKEGIDFWFCGLPVSYRKRRINCIGDISIRFRIKNGAQTEYMKILNDTFKAKLFIFDFKDKVIFIGLKSIKEALSKHKFKTIPNLDNRTEGAYISLRDLDYLDWDKGK